MSKIGCPITLGEYNKIKENESNNLEVASLETISLFDLDDCKNLLKNNPEYINSFVTLLTPDGKIINTFIKLKELKGWD